ncbi:MAG: DUF1836 domain-containing protein [Enterococcus sp.]
MEKIQQELCMWGKKIENFRLPTWEELPDLELYMDQVITLVDRYLSPLIDGEKHPLLTASMVNNYVKQGLIPAPSKKRYGKTHVAFLLAITILKQVLSISEIKEGILFLGKAIGIREAYELFCEEQRVTIYFVSQQAQAKPLPELFSEQVPIEQIAVRSATSSLAMKLLAEKTLTLEMDYLRQSAEEE